MQKVTIQRLGPGDERLVSALNQCFLDVFAEEANHAGPDLTPEYLENLLATPTNIALVARYGDEVIGALSAYELPKFESRRSEIYIYDLAVRPAYRRQGVATALINAIRRHADSCGAWVVYIQAEHDDRAPVMLYSKLGRRDDIHHFELTPLPANSSGQTEDDR